MFPPETKVLVVDDSKSIRKMVRNCLAELKLTQVVEAEDGLDAWNKIRAAFSQGDPFQLVLCDWNMPNMEGIRVLKNVREHSQFKDLAFLMVTTESEKAGIIQAIKLKVSGYVLKPVETDKLREKLEAVWKANPQYEDLFDSE